MELADTCRSGDLMGETPMFWKLCCDVLKICCILFRCGVAGLLMFAYVS